ncbi:MAG: hypothetical protein J4F42_00680 [Desulfurellaceae bacterium]|nr:hypothetical protein [Desulfurellaceae bacterium]
MAWLEQMGERLAATSGHTADSLAVTPDRMRELLELAGLAARSSGNRTNAPLLCYVLGLAVGRGATFDELAETIREALANDGSDTADG